MYYYLKNKSLNSDFSARSSDILRRIYLKKIYQNILITKKMQTNLNVISFLFKKLKLNQKKLPNTISKLICFLKITTIMPIIIMNLNIVRCENIHNERNTKFYEKIHELTITWRKESMPLDAVNQIIVKFMTQSILNFIRDVQFSKRKSFLSIAEADSRTTCSAPLKNSCALCDLLMIDWIIVLQEPCVPFLKQIYNMNESREPILLFICI
ncbi:hypothetical protein BpHYR1_012754 [Brachionus plicatilis]|uniref:Uncharacterized protein n=1 Tax=Brachionus plicatilis TaxID=10195 RepID=A0A3M7SU20_BRAPC|nr:hypothetical protein BpHYR1_012754 [Brachionus plicatilis]